MTTRTFDDWQNASVRISHVSNDFLTISGLINEFIYLGSLDIMINEMCEDSQDGSVDVNIYLRITTLSRLWTMHAYEVIRSLDEFDLRRASSSGGHMANFKTHRFTDLKKRLEVIRIPMVKQEKPKKRGDEPESSYFNIENSGKSNISFAAQGVKISREEIAQEVLDTVNSYERSDIAV